MRRSSALVSTSHLHWKNLVQLLWHRMLRRTKNLHRGLSASEGKAAFPRRGYRPGVHHAAHTKLGRREKRGGDPQPHKPHGFWCPGQVTLTFVTASAWVRMLRVTSRMKVQHILLFKMKILPTCDASWHSDAVRVSCLRPDFKEACQGPVRSLMEQCLHKGMPMTTAQCKMFVRCNKGNWRTECARWLMEHLLLPDTVYTLVKAGPFNMAFTVYEASLSLWVVIATVFLVLLVILSTQSAFQQFKSAFSHRWLPDTSQPAQREKISILLSNTLTFGPQGPETEVLTFRSQQHWPYTHFKSSKIS